ncbi:hypothetical protein [Niastella populi]|uniref:Uncharacterized protein n=1 Tax=Niastella populi TaxID=550983 RepID=A0A1V9F7R8_9BACT|nr:hypothetical protein [Niastella populi]OQP54414.1 hypothetical protein A4R26_28050 [Niastella populi]
MKKMQMTAAILAVVIVAASAFKTSPSTNYQFTRVSGVDRSTNPADYKFQPNDGGECLSSSTKTCLASWNQISAPAVNSQPTGTFVSHDTNGSYQ